MVCERSSITHSKEQVAGPVGICNDEANNNDGGEDG